MHKAVSTAMQQYIKIVNFLLRSAGKMQQRNSTRNRMQHSSALPNNRVLQSHRREACFRSTDRKRKACQSAEPQLGHLIVPSTA